MKTVREWLKTRKNSQFVPIIAIAGNTLLAKRISDDERFFHESVVKFNGSENLYKIHEFDSDHIHVKCIFHDELLKDSPLFIFPINDLSKIEN